MSQKKTLNQKLFSTHIFFTSNIKFHSFTFRGLDSFVETHTTHKHRHTHMTDRNGLNGLMRPLLKSYK